MPTRTPLSWQTAFSAWQLTQPAPRKQKKTGYSGRYETLPDIPVQQTQTLDYRQQGKGRDVRVLYFFQQANAIYEHLPVCIVKDNIPLLDSPEPYHAATLPARRVSLLSASLFSMTGS
jgi:hypothetical protein